MFGDVRIPQLESAQDAIQDSRKRLIITLLFINGGILLLAGAAGYFLAGQTLHPIQEMVLEQRRFISDASHEMRTPLTALRSEIEVGLLDKKMSLNGAKKLLKSNLEEVIHLQKLSNSLLDVSRPSAVVTHTLVSTDEVIGTARKVVSSAARKKAIDIQVKGGSYQISGDKVSLTQLLVIILDNAIKYSPKGSQTTISVSAKGESVMLRIVDQGIGISKEDLPHVFDRFYRADTARTRDGGHGLGLSIAKRIVEEHKGKIQIESRRNAGVSVGLSFLKAKKV